MARRGPGGAAHHADLRGRAPLPAGRARGRVRRRDREGDALRVLIVTDWVPNEGGVETYLSGLRVALARAGHDVELLTSSAGSAAGGSADHVAFGTTNRAGQALLQIANPPALLAARRAVREFRPDVVHVTMFEMFLSPALFAAFRRTPTVLSVSYYKPICPTGIKLLPNGVRCAVRPGLVCVRSGCVGPAHWARDRPRYALIRRAVARADKVVTCSRWMSAELAAHGMDAEAIEWPVPPVRDGFERRPAPDPLFLYAGRLSVEKGVDVLLRAFARTRVAHPRSRLRVLGDGPARGELEALRRRLGLGDSVELAGAVPADGVEPELESAWALVAPSLWAEPLGLVAPEAIVRGVPAIATTGGGFDETVEEGVSGRLVPPGDVSALAAALDEVASGRWGGVPEEAVERARAKHDLDRHVEIVERVLAEARFARFGTSLTPSAPRRLNPS